MFDWDSACRNHLIDSQPQEICFSAESAGASRHHLPGLKSIDTSALPDRYWKRTFKDLMSDTLPPFSRDCETHSPIDAAEKRYRALGYDSGPFERAMSQGQAQFDEAWGNSPEDHETPDDWSEVAKRRGVGWASTMLDNYANIHDIGEATVYEPSTNGAHKQLKLGQKLINNVRSQLGKHYVADHADNPTRKPIIRIPIFPAIHNSSPPPGSSEDWTRVKPSPSSFDSTLSATPPTLAETYTTTPPRTFTSNRGTEHKEPPPMSSNIRSIPPPSFAQPRSYKEVVRIQRRIIAGTNGPDTPGSLQPWTPDAVEDSWCSTARSSGMSGPQCTPLGPVRSGVSGPMVDAGRRVSQGSGGVYTWRGYSHGRAMTSNTRSMAATSDSGCQSPLTS